MESRQQIFDILAYRVKLFTSMFWRKAIKNSAFVKNVKVFDKVRCDTRIGKDISSTFVFKVKYHLLGKVPVIRNITIVCRYNINYL